MGMLKVLALGEKKPMTPAGGLPACVSRGFGALSASRAIRAEDLSQGLPLPFT